MSNHNQRTITMITGDPRLLIGCRPGKRTTIEPGDIVYERNRSVTQAQTDGTRVVIQPPPLPEPLPRFDRPKNQKLG